MSKIKKLVVLCFMMLLGSIIITNSVNAESRYISYTELCTNEKLLCAQHHQSMDGANYNLVATINITGNKSTGKGTTVESWHNAKLASILSHPRGQGIIGGGDVENLPVQNAIWNYLGTWRSNVGAKHGIRQDFINNEKGNYTTSIETEADTYANNYKEGTLTDKTDVNKIKVTSYKENNENYLRVGPFKYEFTGTLSEIEVVTDKQSSMQIKSFEKCMKENEFKKYSKVEDIKSKDEFYISVKMPTDGSNQIKQIKVKNKTNVKHVEIKFWEHTGHSQQNLLEYTYNDQEVPIETPLPYDIKLLGNLKVIKVNKDNKTVKLPNVGFKIQNKDTKEWVEKANGIISYVDSKDKATEFITDKNGEITIKDLIVGTYVAYETQNPNYGYEMITEGKEKDVIVDKTAELQIPNKQKYIKLSGYVWVDNVSGKQSTRNDLYKDGTYDSDDMLLDGITVSLKDKSSGKAIKTTTTENGGAYQFINVLVDDLGKYYIEFKYDGLTYTNVVSHIDKDNGSKSAEKSEVRENFNKGFSSVVGGETANTGETLDENGIKKNDLTYNLTYDANNGAKSELLNNGLYPITANTNETGYSIKAHFKAGQEEIKYINLGLYKREQPDISLVKDLENVRVSINGYNHVYDYKQRFKDGDINVPEDAGDGNVNNFNVGVRYKNKFTGSYSRAIYKADYNYKSPNGTNELEVYVTYRLRINNESSSLMTRVNSIVDYYDAEYKLYSVGTELNGEKNVSGDIAHLDENDKLIGDTIKDESYHENGYSKATINLKNIDDRIEHGKYKDIYVQFKLSRSKVQGILQDKGIGEVANEALDNVAEINSYSVFNKNGNIYSGIDRDSNPGNANPADVTTHQDDTSSAPGLLLEVADAREIAGKVFLDESTGGVGVVREGDGKYTDNEKGISGVTVTLTETSGSGKVYTTTTDENGDFYISGYIPGDYTLTYTWGGQTYTIDNKQYTITVQDYKGTIYKDKDRANNKKWYKITEPRYSDAMDDYAQRQNIDEETENITVTTQTTIDKMDSTTPTMGIGVEYETTYTASSGDRYTYRISNIDFGIVERARQDLALEKRVATFKVTLANGQVVADVTIDENGNKTGETNHVTYIGPSATAMPKNGLLKLELDNELIQGTTIEVGYEIKATNNSELDYLSEEYYHYGEKKGNPVTLTPAAIVDYLDKDWAFDAEKNQAWTVKTLDEMKNIVAEIVYNNENSSISDKTILYTESLKDEKLQPNQSKSVMLNVSKVLANSDEILLNNETEISHINKDGGSIPISIPGNYIPGTGHTESDDSTAETVIVTPNTGNNLGFTLPIVVGVIALGILATGIVIIRKKILGNK